MNGWLKLHRSLLDWEWYSDPNVCRLFIHLLLNANHKAKSWQGQHVPKGGLITGRHALAKETGLSAQQIRTALSKLKSTNEITVQSTSKNSVITLKNWDLYQEDNQQTNQHPTNNQPATNQQATTAGECKKERMEEGKKRVNKQTAQAQEGVEFDFEIWWKANLKHKRTEDPKAACRKKYLANRKAGRSAADMLHFAEIHVAKNATLKKKLGFRGALEPLNVEEALKEGMPQATDVFGDPLDPSLVDVTIIDTTATPVGEPPALLPPQEEFDREIPW